MGAKEQSGRTWSSSLWTRGTPLPTQKGIVGSSWPSPKFRVLFLLNIKDHSDNLSLFFPTGDREVKP